MFLARGCRDLTDLKLNYSLCHLLPVTSCQHTLTEMTEVDTENKLTWSGETTVAVVEHLNGYGAAPDDSRQEMSEKGNTIKINYS